MKIKELIQRVQSLYSKGVQSDDSRLRARHIYSKLMSVRARLVSQELKKKQRLSLWDYQTLPCVELIKVPVHNCPCLPPIGCDILRSKHKLPKPLSGYSGSMIQSVTTLERSIKIDEITINALKSQKGNKYTQSKINYFVDSGYLYITTPTKVSVITVVGLFEDPIEVKSFINFCDDCKDCTNCIDYLEEEFPIDNDMIDALLELSLHELIQIFSQGVEDLTNNSRDNTKEQSK